MPRNRTDRDYKIVSHTFLQENEDGTSDYRITTNKPINETIQFAQMTDGLNTDRWYKKLLRKLEKVQSGELSLSDYIKEVEGKVNGSSV